VLHDLKRVRLRCRAARSCLAWALFLPLCAALGLSQKSSPDESSLPKYDVHTETKTKGVVDEVNHLPLGTKRDITELIIKNGDDKIHIYVCPKAFEEEMGMSLAKGDAISVTGSRVKQDAVDVILARELVKGTDTLILRDGKGNVVWNWRTGK
jgi:hypothetical protein